MDEAKFKLLESTLRDPVLASLVSPVIAASFGTLPLKKEDNFVLLAVTSQYNPECTKVLERVFKSRVGCIPFDDEMVYECIQKFYLKGKSVNLNTFNDEDFLSDEANLSKLISEKYDFHESKASMLSPKEIIFLDISYRSFLENIDFPASHGPFICGSLDIPYRIDNNTPIVFDRIKLASDTFIFLRKNYFYDGDDFHHGILAEEISFLPYLIHPSEIQITQVDSDGAISFYLYDHVEKVFPDTTKQWKFQYYFLNLGSRYKRELTLKINAIRRFKRSRIVYSNKKASWNVEDLERWFEFDFR